MKTLKLSNLSADPQQRSRLVRAGVCLALAVLTWSAFAMVLDNEFIDFDDPEYVTDNPYVTQGLTWTSVRWAFTSGYMMIWHPVTWLSHMLDVELFGLNPRGHHLTSLLIHLFTVLLLFGWLRRTTGDLWASALTAALFAIHPLRVESVAWVAERKDVLSGFFGVLSLWAYGSYVQKGTVARYLLVTVLLALGLMSKAMLVTWPVVLLLADVWPLRRFSNDPEKTIAAQRRSVRFCLLEKAPWLALAGAAVLITLYLHRDGGASSTGAKAPFAILAENALLSCFRYLGKMVYPVNLSLVYPFWPAFHPLRLVAAAAGLAAVSAAAALQIRKRPWLFTGWFWYVITLLPVIGLIHAGSQRMADRYTYLPSIGITAAAAWTLCRWGRRGRAQRWTAGAAAGAAILLLLSLTWLQTYRWKSSLILFEHSIRVTGGDNPTLQVNLAHVLWERGYRREAIAQTRAVLERHPRDYQSAVNLASFYTQMGEHEKAVGYLEAALQTHPNRANTLRGYLAAVYRDRGDLRKAAKLLEEILQSDPENSGARSELAEIRRKQNGTGRDL